VFLLLTVYCVGTSALLEPAQIAVQSSPSFNSGQSASLNSPSFGAPSPSLLQQPMQQSMQQSMQQPMLQPMQPRPVVGNVAVNNPQTKSVMPSSGSTTITISEEQQAFVAKWAVRIYKHRLLVYNIISGQWNEINVQDSVLDVLWFEGQLFIVGKIGNYLSEKLPISGMGGVIVQSAMLTIADTYLTRGRIKAMFANTDVSTQVFAQRVANIFSDLSPVVVAKLYSQVNLEDREAMTLFTVKLAKEDVTVLTVIIYKVHADTVYVNAIYRCKPENINEHNGHLNIIVKLSMCQKDDDTKEFQWKHV
jgi:hypothetical protein